MRQTFITIPKNIDLRSTLLTEVELTPDIKLQSWLCYSWPAQQKDGAGKLTNAFLEQILIMHDKQYQLTLIEEE